DDDTALLLAALLNSTPVRTFARAIAERAKDAHFRFFAWTIASLPLPHAWREHTATPRLIQISREAHDNGSITAAGQVELDRLTAAMFTLDDQHIDSINAFDAWLRGQLPDE